MEWLKKVHAQDTVRKHPAFKTGDDVRVWFKISEQGKQRLAQFEGIVLRVRGGGVSKTFTVRRLTHGEGVERVFPFDSPMIDRIEVVRHAKASRSRLYYLRDVIKKTRLATDDERMTILHKQRQEATRKKAEQKKAEAAVVDTPTEEPVAAAQAESESSVSSEAQKS